MRNRRDRDEELKMLICLAEVSERFKNIDEKICKVKIMLRVVSLKISPTNSHAFIELKNINLKFDKLNLKFYMRGNYFLSKIFDFVPMFRRKIFKDFKKY